MTYPDPRVLWMSVVAAIGGIGTALQLPETAAIGVTSFCVVSAVSAVLQELRV